MKYALIGCGRISPNHLGSAIDHKLEIAAVCDVKEDKARALLEQYHLTDVPIYTDYKKMLDEQNPELVAVATESGYHPQIAVDCIHHGCNVIIEKPLALSMADARRVIAARDEMGVVACINQQNRFNKPVQLLRQQLDAGNLGRLFHAILQMHWMRDENYYHSPSWRGTYALDGGALMNQCIHGIDLLRWTMGGEPTEVMAMTDNLNHPYIEAEDIGLAYPQAIPIVKACVDSALQLGLPEARLPLADAVLLLATAPKSNSGCMAIDAAIADVKAGRTGPVPRELQNVHADGTGFERDQGYLYPHNFPNHWVRQQYLPDVIKDRVYYTYGDNKTEQAAKRYWDEIKK